MFGMKKYDANMVRRTISMAWPAILESFFIAFAGLVDSKMVSRLGTEAVASVGFTTQPKLVGFAMFFALNVAISALVARRKGEQKQDEANRIFSTAMLYVLVAGTIISILMVTFASPLMHLCGTKADTHEKAVSYFRIIMGCMLLNVISMSINAAQRGAGNTRITMRTNVTSNVVNVIANYLLIEGHFGFPAWGVEGAAIATVFGTFVACIMSIASIVPKSCFINIRLIIKNHLAPTFVALKQIVHVGYSVFIEQVLMRVGFMMTAVMAASQGTSEMAAHNIGMNILSLSFAFGDGLQATAVALIGHSLGAKKPEEAKTYGAICRYIGGWIAVTLSFVYFFGGKLLFSLFFPEDPQAVTVGVHITRVIIFIVIFQIAQVIYMGCLRGAGDTAYTAAASTFSVTLVRTAGSYIFGFVVGWGLVGIWLGIFADQFSRFIFGATRFRAGRWTQIKM